MMDKRSIQQLVFDSRSIDALNRIIKKGIIEAVEFPVSTGKEAVVFRAVSGGKYLAVKIYKIETSSFINRQEYLEGDPRFKLVKKTLSEIVYAFTKKEYKNLQIAEKAGVRAPRPIFQHKNVIVMSFLGRDGVPYPQLYKAKEVREEHFWKLVEDVKKLYRAGLVHSDLSEFNVLLGEEPWMVDFAQGVVLSHPKAREFLKRDISNICSFFSKKLNKSFDPELIYKEVVS